MNVDKLWQKALRYLNYRDYTIQEMYVRLMGLEGAKKADVSTVIEKLKKAYLLDDDMFTRLYVGRAFNSYEGINGVISNLTKKGISKELQDKYIDEYTIEQERENALRYVQAKYNSNYNKGLGNFKQAMRAKLREKGFTTSTINITIEEIDMIVDDDKEDGILEKALEKVYYQVARKHKGYEHYRVTLSKMINKGFAYKDIVIGYNKIMEQEDNNENI